MSNLFSFVGRLARDAEVRTLQSGHTLLSATLAHDVGFGDAKKTLWVRANIWGKRAEGKLADYLKKGQQVWVSGELSQGEYTDKKTNEKKTSLDLNVQIIELIGSKRDDATPAPVPVQAYTPPPVQHSGAVYQAAQDYEEDIPF
jgi:single-strand DNA-binding protein